MDFKMVMGLVASAVGLVGALAAVLVVLLGHPQTGVTPYPTPRYTPTISGQFHAHFGTTICHRHC